jgi:hypothetical protein
MIRVLLVLGLVACDREAREETRPVAAPRPIARPSPAPALPAIAPVEADDVDVGPTDYDVIADEDGSAGDEAVDDNRAPNPSAVAVADRPTGDKPTVADDDTTDHDVDDIPDELDKCPDVPENVDGFEDIDGCPEPMNSST